MERFVFDPNKDSFDFPNALALLQASELAYEGEAKIKSTCESEWGFDECEYFEASDTQGFVAKRKDMVLLAFRGTQQSETGDILTDLFAWRKKMYWGKAHAGFLEAFEAADGKMSALLKAMQDKDQPIWITGHSLGGALATLAAARLAHDKAVSNIKGIYTYGQPLVGDAEFKKNMAAAFAGKFYRITNFTDPVSVVPLECWKYRHVGDIVLMDEQGKHVQESNVWLRRALFVFSIVAVIMAKVNKNSELFKKRLADMAQPHGLSVYRENILKNIKV